MFTSSPPPAQSTVVGYYDMDISSLEEEKLTTVPSGKLHSGDSGSKIETFVGNNVGEIGHLQNLVKNLQSKLEEQNSEIEMLRTDLASFSTGKISVLTSIINTNTSFTFPYFFQFMTKSRKCGRLLHQHKLLSLSTYAQWTK